MYWAVGSFEHATYRHHADHASFPHETMLEKTPAVVPAKHSSLDLEALERLEIAPEFGDRISNDGHRLVASCRLQNARTQEPVHAPDVCEREVSAVVHVQIEVQIGRPHTHAHPSCRKMIEAPGAERDKTDTE